MAKTRMNFRLSDEACRRLAELSAQWGMNATEVIETLLSNRGDPQPVDAISPTSGSPGSSVTRGKITVSEKKVRVLALGSATKLAREVPKPSWKTKAEGET